MYTCKCPFRDSEGKVVDDGYKEVENQREYSICTLLIREKTVRERLL